MNRESWLRRLEEGVVRARRLGHPVVVAERRKIQDPPDPLDGFTVAEALGHNRFFAAGPGQSFVLLGLGAVIEILSDDDDPIADVKQQAMQQLECADSGLLWTGGFAFAPRPRAQRAPEWSAFPNGRFTLPEILFMQTPEGCWLTQIARVGPADDPRKIALRPSPYQIERPTAPGANGTRPASATNTQSARSFESAASEVIAAIRREEASKVVLARSEQLTFASPCEATHVLRTLRRSHPHSYVFGQGFARTDLVGATPEQLVRRRGNEITASAVAGTSALGEDADMRARLARVLHTSPKERAEHAFVVRGIENVLGDLCDPLEVPRSPGLLETGTVQHLHTRIRGTLCEPMHVLDLVSRLHPTPAVGGTPCDRALELIRKHEPFDRGWYAGPIGWFNASGEGDFVVALRCGLLSRDQAIVFAGAGLVADSDPARETAETSLKLRALLDALESPCSP